MERPSRDAALCGQDKSKKKKKMWQL
jgi:hypothetical protein